MSRPVSASVGRGDLGDDVGAPRVAERRAGVGELRRRATPAASPAPASTTTSWPAPQAAHDVGRERHAALALGRLLGDSDSHGGGNLYETARRLRRRLAHRTARRRRPGGEARAGGASRRGRRTAATRGGRRGGGRAARRRPSRAFAAGLRGRGVRRGRARRRGAARGRAGGGRGARCRARGDGRQRQRLAGQRHHGLRGHPHRRLAAGARVADLAATARSASAGRPAGRASRA